MADTALTLGHHLDTLNKRRPRAASRRVQVDGGVDVGPRLVNGGLDDKTRRVDLVLGRLHGGAGLVDQHEIARLHQREVHGVGVDPEMLGVHGVAEGDVT